MVNLYFAPSAHFVTGASKKYREAPNCSTPLGSFQLSSPTVGEGYWLLEGELRSNSE
jgi:hypothetical protein